MKSLELQKDFDQRADQFNGLSQVDHVIFVKKTVGVWDTVRVLVRKYMGDIEVIERSFITLSETELIYLYGLNRYQEHGIGKELGSFFVRVEDLEKEKKLSLSAVFKGTRKNNREDKVKEIKGVVEKLG